MSATQLKKMSWWHESILDWELNNPDKSMGECALTFGVTETWLSIIRNSDIYKEYAAQRRILHNENVSKSIIERVEEVAGVSLEVLQERIDRERHTIGLGIVNDTCGMALKALGFGVKHGGEGSQVNVMIGVASPELLDRAREKMRLIGAHSELDRVGASDPPETEVENPDKPPRLMPTTA